MRIDIPSNFARLCDELIAHFPQRIDELKTTPLVADLVVQSR